MRRSPLVLTLATAALLAGALPIAAAAQSPATSPAADASPAAATSPAAVGDPDLARAVDATMASGTLRSSFSVTFGGEGTVPDGTTISGTGQLDLGLERHQQLSMDMTAFQIGVFDLIVDGQRVYVRGLPFPGLPEDKWLTADLTSDDPAVAALRSLASGNNDASLLLYYLLGATGPAELVGDETIDGTPVRHLRATLDLGRALGFVEGPIAELLSDNMAEIEQGGVQPVLGADVWVDGSDLVHRLVLGYELGDAFGGGTMTASFDFRDHGKPLDLEIPAPEDTVDITTLGS